MKNIVSNTACVNMKNMDLEKFSWCTALRAFPSVFHFLSLTSPLQEEEATKLLLLSEKQQGGCDGCLCDAVEHSDLRSSRFKDSLEKERDRERRLAMGLD